jgi:hypothetical protein
MAMTKLRSVTGSRDKSNWRRSFAAYTDRRVLQVLALGFASGLPLLLTYSTLSAWLATAGVRRAAIGTFALVGTPYAFKFLWSPAATAPVGAEARLGYHHPDPLDGSAPCAGIVESCAQSGSHGRPIGTRSLSICEPGHRH